MPEQKISLTDDAAEGLKELIAAIRSISHGDAYGATGLEALGMAISGANGTGRNCLSDAVREGLSEIAEAQRQGLNEIAASIREVGIKS